MKFASAFDRIRDVSLGKVGLGGLAIAALRQLPRLPAIVHMARTWPVLVFAGAIGWRLIQLPILMIMAVLLVRGATQERL